ncbi:MAG TPA: DedA family protein [Herpetosiphonaceae bacterium]|nr:DedA family protein [Herpetosiphonaceae bacterium]
MAALMEQLQQWIEAIITTIGYGGIALVMFAENLFPPIPSELVMPLAGFIVERGEMHVVGVLVAGTLGAVLGALALYYIGMWADAVIIRRFVRRYGRFFLISEQDMDRTLAFFDRHGQKMVFFGRLIPLVRSLISVPAGMNRMPLGRFLLWTTMGSLIWNGVLTYAGILLGANWEQVLGIVGRYETVALGLIALGVGALLVTRILRWRKDKAAA